MARGLGSYEKIPQTKTRMNKVSIAKNHERWAVMDRVFVCTLMLLILLPGMVLAQKTFEPLSPAVQDDYLDLLLTPTENGLLNVDVYLGIEDKNRETDSGKSLYPELIADASDGDANTDADGNDNTDSDDDSDKGNDTLTPAERQGFLPE